MLIDPRTIHVDSVDVHGDRVRVTGQFAASATRLIWRSYDIRDGALRIRLWGAVLIGRNGLNLSIPLRDRLSQVQVIKLCGSDGVEVDIWPANAGDAPGDLPDRSWGPPSRQVPRSDKSSRSNPRSAP